MFYAYTVETGDNGDWDHERAGTGNPEGTAGDYALDVLAGYLHDVRHDARNPFAEPAFPVRVTVTSGERVAALVTYTAS